MALAIDGSVSNKASATSCTFTLTTASNPDVIIVCAGVNGSTAAPTVSSTSLSWTSRYNGFSNSGIGTSMLMYYAIANAPLSSEVITVQGNVNTTFVSGTAFGVSGANVITPFDGANVNFGSNTHGNPFDPLTISTTNANTMIIGAWRFSSTSTPSAGSGYTGISIGTGNFFLAERQIVSSPQTNLSVTVGTGVGDSNGGCADAIVAQAAATSVPFTIGFATSEW